MPETKIYRGNMTFWEITDKFVPEEFVSEQLWNICKQKPYPVTWFIDPDIVGFLHWIRITTGAKVFANTWKWKKPGRKIYNWRAIRVWWLYTSLAKLSQHYFLNGIDFVVEGWKPAEILKLVQDNFEYVNREFGITTAEALRLTTDKNGNGWNHFDKRWWGRKLVKLMIVGLKKAA